MASASLYVASGAVAVGDSSTGLGIGVAKVATLAGIGVARGATAFGLGVARACVMVPAAVAGVAGPNRLSTALWRADDAIAGAHEVTARSLVSANARAQGSMTGARNTVSRTLEGTRGRLHDIAQRDGINLRVVLGKDAVDVIIAVRNVIREFGGPVFPCSTFQIYRAAKAWAALQRAARESYEEMRIAGDVQVTEATLPEDSERWMRFSVAAFGAHRAGKMFDDKEAALREEQRIRREALRHSEEKRQSVLANFAESIANSEGASIVPLPSRSERRVAAAKAKRERRAANLAEREARRAMKAQKKGAAQPSFVCTLELAEESVDDYLDAAEAVEEGLVAECLADILDGEDELLLEPLALPSDVEASQGIEMTAADGRIDENEIALEVEDLKYSRAATKAALTTVCEQERQARLATWALRRRAMLEASVQGKEALKAALDQWKTPAGRARQALSCAGLNPDTIDVVRFEEANAPPPGEPHVPGQLIAVDREKGCVVVALRGSSCLQDALVDMDFKPEPVSFVGLQGFAHGGMLQSAKKLAEPLAADVDKALAEIPDGSRRILVVGHSLGGGVGALLTALWHENGGRFPAVEIRCLAFGCPQVFSAELALAMASHTTSLVVGNDCVPCLSLATCLDLRDALVVLAHPESRSLDASYGVADALAAIGAGDRATLVDKYRAVREIVGLTSGRLYPSGRLVKHIRGHAPWLADHSVVDEMIVTTDMVTGHFPRQYLASAQEIAAAGGCCEPLWTDCSASFTAGIALAMHALPVFQSQ